jgi:hypothetical protein
MKKKIYQILPFILLFAVLSGCGYMDEIPYERAQPEDIFTAETQYEKPATQAYSFLKPGKSRVDDAFLEAATDNAISVVYDSDVHLLARAYISAASPVETCWDDSYKGIRQALYAAKNYREQPLRLQNKTEADIEKIKEVLIAELTALRAVFELDLLRHYGGYPIIDQVYETGDPAVANIKRNSFADCVQHIVSLCDFAAERLDVEPRGAAGGYGRMTKGGALAVKAKTLIFAASPLYNRPDNANPLLGYTGASTGDVAQRWKDAAKACAEVINLKNAAGNKKYTLFNAVAGGLSAYERLFIIQPNNNTEYIVTANSAKANNLERRQYPPSKSVFEANAGGGTVPTQEFVDVFTRADGSDFVRTATGGAEQYQERDPRLKVIVVYNGAPFNSQGVIYTKKDKNNRDGLNTDVKSSTVTGYYMRKFLDLTVNFNSASAAAVAFHYYPIIRLADIYLMYAEAMTLGYGVDTDPEGFGLTAKGAVQAIRQRAGFAGSDKFLDGVTTPEQMMRKIKQERRIELCFEEHYYFDLRRWMDAETVLNKPVTGVSIETLDGVDHYSYFTVDGRRRFGNQMYYHPIPINEIKITPSVEQNPGW